MYALLSVRIIPQGDQMPTKQETYHGKFFTAEEAKQHGINHLGARRDQFLRTR